MTILFHRVFLNVSANMIKITLILLSLSSKQCTESKSGRLRLLRIMQNPRISTTNLRSLLIVSSQIMQRQKVQVSRFRSMNLHSDNPGSEKSGNVDDIFKRLVALYEHLR